LIESAAVESLKSGSWVKFISGASNQDLPLIRNMCYLYTLAGVDCIDLSTDPAVIAVANEGIEDAINFLNDDKIQKPIIMMSVNDDEDPHFRKAVFNPEKCPTSCPRPCEKVCPAWAIPPIIDSKDKLDGNQIDNKSTKIDNMDVEGVIASRCYGCGRCIPICPLGLIITESYTVSRETIKLLFTSRSVEAIEIHTLQNHEEAFSDLWDSIGHEVLSYAKILSISFPNMGDDTVPYLDSLQSIITKSSAWDAFKGVQIWQTDGRPMSGDIGTLSHVYPCILLSTLLNFCYLYSLGNYIPIVSRLVLIQYSRRLLTVGKEVLFIYITSILNQHFLYLHYYCYDIVFILTTHN
jgi:Fe-S-cluster-containing hydrogenase component 2